MDPVNASYLIREIDLRENKLNYWEKSFMSSVRILVSDGKYLSDKQAKHLQALYRKYQQGNYERKRTLG